MTYQSLDALQAACDATTPATWAELARVISGALDSLPVGTVIGDNPRYTKKKAEGLGWYFHSEKWRVNKLGRRVDEGGKAWGASWGMAMDAVFPANRRNAPLRGEIIAAAWAGLSGATTQPEAQAKTKPARKPRKPKTLKPLAPSREDRAGQIAATLPDDEPGLMASAAEAVAAFHAAVLASDDDGADHARDTYGAVIYKLNGGTFSSSYANQGVSPGYRVDDHCAAVDDGSVPLWGQRGRFILDMGAYRVLVLYKGFCGIISASVESFEFRALDFDRPFISETGYRSEMTPLIGGHTVDQVARMAVERLASAKGGLREIEANYRQSRQRQYAEDPVYQGWVAAALAAPQDQAPAVPAQIAAKAAPKKARVAKPKPKSYSELTVFWTNPWVPAPADVATFDDGRTAWTCTVLDRAFEKEIQAEHAPKFPLGSGWACGWAPVYTEEPKRWKPERKATARRQNLRKRLDKKFPLFADLFEVQEIERRPDYFDAAAIEAGTDIRPVVDSFRPTPRRPRRPVPLSEAVQLDFLAVFDQTAPAQPQQPARRLTAPTVASVARQLTRRYGKPVTAEDLGQSPFDAIDPSRIPPALLRRGVVASRNCRI